MGENSALGHPQVHVARQHLRASMRWIAALQHGSRDGYPTPLQILLL
jgi:hypothetical protein